jgi:hypothetical protein
MQVFGVQLGNLASVAGATVNSRWQLVQTKRMASDHSRMKVHDPRHPRRICTRLTPATTTGNILMAFEAIGPERKHL